MSTQPTLFGPQDAYGGFTPAAHRDDPQTSHEAAASIIESGARSRHCAIVLAIVRLHPGSTYAELFSAATDVERSELREAVAVARRLPDLERAGMVWRGESRICRVKKTKMHIWGPK